MNAPLRPLSFRPIDDVEVGLIEHWREVSKSTYRFLVLLREFDLRQGWKPYGLNDCAEWLDWKCGLSRVTAQEKVRVARARIGLPRIEAAFAAGGLSYSKVRALCRVATERNETELLGYALKSTATQVEHYCRRLGHGDAEVSAVDARRIHERRWLSRSVREDGSGTLTVDLPKDQLDLVLAALDTVAKTLPEDPTRSIFATGADALVRMAEGVLRHESGTGRSDLPVANGRTPTEVVVHIAARALAGQGGETTLDNLICLCTTHHRLIHEGGFAIQRCDARRNGDGAYYFVRPLYRLERDSAEWREGEAGSRGAHRCLSPTWARGQSPNAAKSWDGGSLRTPRPRSKRDIEARASPCATSRCA